MEGSFSCESDGIRKALPFAVSREVSIPKGRDKAKSGSVSMAPIYSTL